MAASVAAALRERQHTVSVSESSGGGLISACLVAIAGASDYYVGGVVSYTRAAQKGMSCTYSDEAMQGLRASTEAYALLNARALLETVGTTWALSETGRQRPHRQPLRRLRRPRLHRSVRPRGEEHHHRDRRRQPRSQHVGLRSPRPRPPRGVHPRSSLVTRFPSEKR